MQYLHTIKLAVRDYECDMQGVVNNAVYQNYLEHARHDFLLSRQLNFAKVTAQGIHLVVIRAELDYLDSLKSSDVFEVKSGFHRLSRVRFEFLQDIYRLGDNKLMLKARVIGTALNERGRPYAPEILDQLDRESDN